MEQHTFTNLLEKVWIAQACLRRAFLLQFVICAFLVSSVSNYFCTIVVSNAENSDVSFAKEGFCITLYTMNYLEDTCFSVTNIILKERGLHPSFSVMNIKHLQSL